MTGLCSLFLTAARKRSLVALRILLCTVLLPMLSVQSQTFPFPDDLSYEKIRDTVLQIDDQPQYRSPSPSVNPIRGQTVTSVRVTTSRALLRGILQGEGFKPYNSFDPQALNDRQKIAGWMIAHGDCRNFTTPPYNGSYVGSSQSFGITHLFGDDTAYLFLLEQPENFARPNPANYGPKSEYELLSPNGINNSAVKKIYQRVGTEGDYVKLRLIFRRVGDELREVIDGPISRVRAFDGKYMKAFTQPVASWSNKVSKTLMVDTALGEGMGDIVEGVQDSVRDAGGLRAVARSGCDAGKSMYRTVKDNLSTVPLLFGVGRAGMQRAIAYGATSMGTAAVVLGPAAAMGYVHYALGPAVFTGTDDPSKRVLNFNETVRNGKIVPSYGPKW